VEVVSIDRRGVRAALRDTLGGLDLRGLELDNAGASSLPRGAGDDAGGAILVYSEAGETEEQEHEPGHLV
jgi:hypothetical protein